VKTLFQGLRWVGLFLLLSVAASQAQDQATQSGEAPTIGEDRMLTPPPVSGQAYPVGLASQEHANSLHYGVIFSPAYSDNVLGTTSRQQVSDMSYSLWPTIGVDESTSRLHWDFTYAPGFTFYQRTSGRNEADHNANVSFEYRLSPHVTFSAQDSFQKSSSVFNQPSYASGQVFGGAQGPNDSIIAPLADRLSNYGTAGITYQYARNDMVGAGGSFSRLHYPDPSQVPGLYDSSSQTGSAFYTHRASGRHYIGVGYQYQRLMSYPEDLDAETQTHSVFPFYTVFLTPRFSMSFFGGAQYANAVQPAVGSLGYAAFSMRSWSPAGGASLSYQGHFVSGALTYSHRITDGGGLIGAVTADTAAGSIGLQLSRTLTGFISGSYDNNKEIGHGVGAGGHTNSGSVGLQRQVGEHFGVQLGYMRVHQTYNTAAITTAPNTNRAFVSFSYMFARPLGR
jgi:hypothetical protein